jgi:DNA-binding NtrC family response regulator
MRHRPQTTVSRANVLLIDDDIQVRQALGKALVAENYLVQPAATGEEAVNEVLRGTIDIALLDLRLGKECGWNVYQQLYAIQPRLHVIVMTGWPQVTLNPGGLTPVATLCKPLDLVNLFATLARLSKGRRPQRVTSREAAQ